MVAVSNAGGEGSVGIAMAWNPVAIAAVPVQETPVLTGVAYVSIAETEDPAVAVRLASAGAPDSVATAHDPVGEPAVPIRTVHNLA